MKLIIANWKNHPEGPDEAMALAASSDVEGLIIAPPMQYFPIVAKLLQHAALASQDFENGSYIKNLGARYAIIGHSDYRAHGETDERIAQKIKSAHELDVMPILCVGESRADHDAGKAKEFVANQLRIDLSLIKNTAPLKSLLIAYEPIWSISTTPGATPEIPEDAAAMIQLIKELVREIIHDTGCTFDVLYGGSINEENVEVFLKQEVIDGFLVGGASLLAESIKKIVETAIHSDKS